MSDLSESPSSVLLSQNLQKTIFFGNETEDSDDQEQENISWSKVISSRRVKSLSDLEFEELKGFMDLGFVFTIKDKDSNLASIIPGLQRLGNANDDEINNNIIVNIVDDEKKCAISRPYLSEAWEMGQGIRTREMLGFEKKKQRNVLNLKVPDCTNQMDMKSYIKIWARNVASMVR
ncbi:uncharacterized protein LOC141594526 [Silene latifolia]|uniref:uncharacterized protein LOC141594526 n=1 Tax=Silene latifolia TaxID=37657 RepID=UPI003D774D28